MNTLEALRLTESLLGLSLVVQTLEHVWTRRALGPNGVWDWAVVRDEFAALPAAARAILDALLGPSGFGVVLGLRAAAALALMAWGGLLPACVASVTTALVCLRFRGLFNGGSDYMTVHVGLALTAAHAAAGRQYMTATVLGRPEAVAAGKLFVLAAGPAEVVDPLMPVLDALGQRTFRVSDVAAVGNVVKLSANFLLANVIESLGEAVALVSKAGVDRRDYIDIITSTLFSAPAYETYGGLIAREEFEPAGFAARLGIKDIRLVLAAAEELEVPLPIASLLRDRFLALLASGGGDLDWSAISTLAQRDAGL